MKRIVTYDVKTGNDYEEFYKSKGVCLYSSILELLGRNFFHFLAFQFLDNTTFSGSHLHKFPHSLHRQNSGISPFMCKLLRFRWHPSDNQI